MEIIDLSQNVSFGLNVSNEFLIKIAQIESDIKIIY